MATYNFAKQKVKKENLDDTHINMRLKDQHSDAPEVITEKQLDKKDHEGEQDVLIEKQLDKARTGSAEVILEKNLNDSKGLFGAKHRNESAYAGDINKLEEKRLSGHVTEGEKYEAASSTPSKLKWWENLKKASSTSLVKEAAKGDDDDVTDFSPESSFGRMKDIYGEDPDANEGLQPDSGIGLTEGIDGAEAVGEVEEDEQMQPDVPKKLFVTENKEGQTPVPHIYMSLSFDPSAFESDEEVKQFALERVLEMRPNLDGKISIEDFSTPKAGSFDSTIALRLIEGVTGEGYFNPLDSSGVEGGESGEMGSVFANIESQDIDMGGTPMTVGKISLKPESEGVDINDLLLQAVDYIADQTGVEVPAKAITVNMEKKEITFAWSPSNTSDELNPETPNASSGADLLEEDFPVDEVSTDELEDLGDLSEDVSEEPISEDQMLDPEVSGPPPKVASPTSIAKTDYDFPIIMAEDIKKK